LTVRPIIFDEALKRRQVGSLNKPKQLSESAVTCAECNLCLGVYWYQSVKGKGEGLDDEVENEADDPSTTPGWAANTRNIAALPYCTQQTDLQGFPYMHGVLLQDHHSNGLCLWLH
jgi:hypothetical protein